MASEQESNQKVEIHLTKNPYPHTRTFANFWRIHGPSFQSSNYDEDQLPFPRRSSFLGTIKLHGANCSIIFNNGNYDNVVLQSRNTVLGAGKDNKGTVKFLTSKPLGDLAREVSRLHGPWNEMMIAGEMCGRGVNKGVAISLMEPFFVVFNIRIDGLWVDMRDFATVHLPDERIWNIMNWETWNLDVDFQDSTSVQTFQDKMDQLVEEIDNRCPFAFSFNDKQGRPFTGKGEGVVWTLLPPTRGQIRKELINFKTKGETFDTVVRIASLPPAKGDQTATERAKRFVTYALTNRRMEQGIEWLVEVGGKDEKYIGKHQMKEWADWVLEDMIREEGYMMHEMGADEIFVRKAAFTNAKEWFFNWLDSR